MKNFLIFLLGGGVGAGIMYLVMSKKLSKDIPESSSEEETYSEPVRRSRREDPIDTTLKDNKDYIFGFLHDLCSDEEEEIGILAERLQELGVNLVYSESDEEYDGDDVNPVDASNDIYEIDEIVNNTTHTADRSDVETVYDKKLIYFYEDDQTFVDAETDSVVEEWKESFGDDILNILEDHNWRKSNVYIRNEEKESDYEIVKYDGSYAAANGESDDEDDYASGDFADKRDRRH